MKGKGIILAWLVGETIVIYRSAWKEKRPPWPSELLFSSLVFVALAFIAEAEQLATAATIAAWGFDIAAYMNVAPGLPVNQPKTSTSTTPPIINNQGRTV